MERAPLTKRMEITLVCVGRPPQSALVTLTRTGGARSRWSASTTAACVTHVTAGHADERAALLEVADWLRTTLWAKTTCPGSMVTIVGVSESQRGAA